MNISVIPKEVKIFLCLILVMPLFTACDASGAFSRIGFLPLHNSTMIEDYYITGSEKHQENLQDLFNLLEQETDSGEQNTTLQLPASEPLYSPL